MYGVRSIYGNNNSIFIKQQESIDKVNGYIEEMINGQKVVKVFTHEDESIEKFREINEQLCNDATLVIYAIFMIICRY